MKWWKVEFAVSNRVHWCYGADEIDAMANAELLGTGLQYVINPCSASAIEVPVVRRGLAEATVEQLRDELKRRGWKLKLS